MSAGLSLPPPVLPEVDKNNKFIELCAFSSLNKASRMKFRK